MEQVSLCQGISPFIYTVGKGLSIVRLSLPLIILVLAVFTLAKGILSSKENSLKDAVKALIYKLLICALIFFLPNIIIKFYGLLGEYNFISEVDAFEYQVCYDCMFKPNGKNCTSALEKTEENNNIFENDEDTFFDDEENYVQTDDNEEEYYEEYEDYEEA